MVTANLAGVLASPFGRGVTPWRDGEGGILHSAFLILHYKGGVSHEKTTLPIHSSHAAYGGYVGM
ncbi:MAG: hypothetical protein FWH14_03600 [Oscillospiraceae bacterium]|nr:hypothetical protein [Oscillospiraceae bacterium]